MDGSSTVVLLSSDLENKSKDLKVEGWISVVYMKVMQEVF